MNPTVQLIEPEVRELIDASAWRSLRDVLARLEPVDIADVLTELPGEEASIAFRLLRRDHAADVLACLEPDSQESLLGQLSTSVLRAFEEMDPDDRAELLDEMPDSLAKRLIATLDDVDRAETQRILGYAPESIGRLMTPHYVRVRPEWSVARALEHIRRYGQDAETIHWVYIVDDRGRLIDDVHIRTFLLADPEEQVRELMDEQHLALQASDDREEAVRMMMRYDRTVLPVLDSREVLLGIVTIDDVADVAAEEATEDIQKLAGMEALGEPYMLARLGNVVRKRGSVLCVLLLAQTITIGVLGLFERQLQAVSALVLFIPLIIASGGNIGTQTASLLIRALALDELAPRDWRRVLQRELLTGVLLGLAMGSLAFISVQLWNLTPRVDASNPGMIGLAVGLAVLGIVLWGVTLGSMFPLLLHRFRLDPATISSPLVATLMDVSGLIIYLVIAVLLLGL